MTDDDQANVFGRLVALELLMQNLMTAAAATHYAADPVAGIDEMRRDTLSSLQNLDRPIDDFGEEIWRHNVEALELRFANVRKRLESIFRQE